MKGICFEYEMAKLIPRTENIEKCSTRLGKAETGRISGGTNVNRTIAVRVLHAVRRKNKVVRPFSLFATCPLKALVAHSALSELQMQRTKIFDNPLARVGPTGGRTSDVPLPHHRQQCG